MTRSVNAYAIALLVVFLTLGALLIEFSHAIEDAFIGMGFAEQPLTFFGAWVWLPVLIPAFGLARMARRTFPRGCLLACAVFWGAIGFSLLFESAIVLAGVNNSLFIGLPLVVISILSVILLIESQRLRTTPPKRA